MERLFCKNESENSKVAKLVLETLKNRKCNLLLLRGNLGAGKTTLASALTKLLNSKNRSSSPTFVIQKIYTLDNNEWGFKRVFHTDLYRLRSDYEIEEINLFDNKGSKNLHIVEWPQKYSRWPNNKVTVEIKEKNKGRVFTIQ